MSQPNNQEITKKTYEIKVILEECANDELRKIIWHESLACFPTEI